MYTIVRNFFWFCAGINRRLLLECDTDSSKYFAIGATVFFTACFAGLSGGYALYFVFSGTDYAMKASVIFGVLWGITIFNIDRFLVISIKKQNKPLKELGMAVPRIVLAVMIGIVIARPLELRLYNKEIQEGLKQFYLEEQKLTDESKHDFFDNKYRSETNNLKFKRDERSNAYKEWENAKKLQLEEANGVAGKLTSGKIGWGPKTIALQADVNKKEAIYNRLDTEVINLEHKIKNARNAARIDEVKNMDDSTLDALAQNAGFHDRNKILEQISAWTPWSATTKKQDRVVSPLPGVKDTAKSKIDSAQSVPVTEKRQTISRFDGENDKTVFFISMLLIIIECLPLIVKLLIGRGTYDIRLEEEEERIRFLARHETYANKHLIQQLAISQREVLTKAIDQWRENEMTSETLGRRYINSNEEDTN